MKIVILYGPPGIGKLTIGRELAVLTGFKLLDNHLFFDIGIRLYERFSSELEELYEALHLLTFRHAHQRQISGIITTICTSDPRSWTVWKQLDSSVGKAGIEYQFAQLRCDELELLKRIESEDRTKRGKLDNASVLTEVLASKDYQSIHDDVFSLDVTALRPLEAASSIANHFALLRGA